MSDIELPDLPEPELGEGSHIYVDGYTAEQMRAYAIADREKRAPAAQPAIAEQPTMLEAGKTYYTPDGHSITVGLPKTGAQGFNRLRPGKEGLDWEMVMFGGGGSAGEGPAGAFALGGNGGQAPGASGTAGKAYDNFEEPSKPVQAEAPSDDADPLTPEQEEWVMDLAEKHNLGRRVPQIGALRGVAPDVFYTDASYRTHELFCFAAELLAAKQAGREPVASIYVSPNGEREFDDWGHDLPVGRNELCLATKQAEAPTASNERARIDLSQWEKARFGYFDQAGRFVEFSGEDNELPNDSSPRWVGGLHDMQLLRAALATQQVEAPTASNAEREHFESTVVLDTGDEDADFRRNDDGRYANYYLELAWNGWQARAAFATQQEAQPQAEPEGPDFTVDDPDLSDLLNFAAMMARGEGGMDLGIAWLDALEKVEARLAAQAEPAGADKEDAHRSVITRALEHFIDSQHTRLLTLPPDTSSISGIQRLAARANIEEAQAALAARAAQQGERG